MGTGSFGQTDLIELLNDAVIARVHEVRRRFPFFGAKTSTVSQVKGTWSYSTPADFESLLTLRNIGTDNQVSAEVMPVDPMSIRDTGFAFSYETAWKLKFVNQNTTQAWTLAYTYKPVRVHYGTLAAVGDTTATLATTPTGGTCFQKDDYYNNAQLLDTTNWKIWNITDYVGSTRVATVDWVSATKPTGTPTYEILPMIDAERFEALLSWDVAMSVMQIDRNDTGRRSPEHAYSKAISDFDLYWMDLQKRAAALFGQADFEAY